MDLPDFAPTDRPTPDQQRDALRKGLGRARLWADAGRLDDGPLLEACLHDLRHDTQIDDGRADWLWGLIEVAGAVDRLRAPILAALTELAVERDAPQLCSLAAHYAKAGDGRFRDRLSEIVATRPYPESYLLGEGQLVWLDGAAGFLFIARLRGEQLATRAWDDDEWHDRSSVWHAGEELGEEVVARLLAEATDPPLVRFAQAHQAAEEEREREWADRPRRQDWSVVELLQAATSGNLGYRLRAWGEHAAEADLRVVAERLREADDPREIRNLLYVFAGRPMPDFDPALLELCRHDDAELRRRAFMACGQVTHEAVRTLGLAELARGIELAGAIDLMVRNFEPGDEARIVAALQMPDDADEQHSLLMSVRNLLEANPDADASVLGLIFYAFTPCEHCRRTAVRLLLDRAAAPDWLVAECRHDNDERIRELVAADPPAAGGTDDSGAASK